MKRNITLIALAFVFGIAQTNAQVSGSPDVIRMSQAKSRISEGDYQGALEIYKQLYTAHGTNPLLNFRIAESYIALNQGKDAMAYVDKARELDPNVDKELEYLAAQAYRAVGKQTEALARLDVYLKQEKLKKEDVDKAEALRSKCNTTLELMAKPVNVKIANAGNGINSADHHDYHPSITADGKIMVFTSRRPTDEKAPKDNFDEDYYEKCSSPTGATVLTVGHRPNRYLVALTRMAATMHHSAYRPMVVRCSYTEMKAEATYLSVRPVLIKVPAMLWKQSQQTFRVF